MQTPRPFPKRSPFRRDVAARPVGTIHVVDPSPLNWLYITYNTVEELVRVNPEGKIRPAAMRRRYRWEDDRTLRIDVRRGERFPNGEPMTAAPSSAPSTSRGAGSLRTRRGPTSTWTSERRARRTASTR